MNVPAAVVDTNVVVAGLLTSDVDSPTARILDGMLEARFPFLLSVALLAEYREVLLRPRIHQRHRLSEGEIDSILTAIALNGVVRDPQGVGAPAPQRGDAHLWELLASQPGSVLVTGDKALFREAPKAASVLSPAGFVERLRAQGG